MEMYDSFIDTGIPSHEYEFYEPIITQSMYAKTQTKMPSLIYSQVIAISDQQVVHERKVYGILDLLGEMGGVLDILVSILGIFLFLITEYSFILKALEKLYLAKTSDRLLFQKFQQKKKNMKKNKFLTMKKVLPESMKNTDIEKEVANHYPIRIDMCQKL